MGEAMYDDVGNVEYDIMQYTRYSYIETTCLQRSLLIASFTDVCY